MPRYAVIVMLDTPLEPQVLSDEIRSTLEFDASLNTTVQSVVVLNEEGDELAVYDRKEKQQ